MSNGFWYLVIHLIVGIWCGFKWYKTGDREYERAYIWTLSLIAAPIVLVIALVRQFVIEDWK